ncbi:MAG: nucleotidyltransferase family protein [Vampirovibrionales bacterium]
MSIYSLEEIRALLQQHRHTLEEDYNASAFFVFGSYARHEQTEHSDIDLLVDFKAPVGLLKHAQLQGFLESLFQKHVDLGTFRGLNPRIKAHIENEAIRL